MILVARDLGPGGQRSEDPVADLEDLTDGDVLQQHRELVPAETGHGVDVTNVGHQPPRDLDQHRVTRSVAEPVVDRLEAVEVDEEQGHPHAAPAGAVQGLRGPVEQDAAVGQVGQGVVPRVVDHLVGQLEAGERLRADHGERVQRVLVGADRRPGAVPRRGDDPERVLAPAYLRTDLVLPGRRAAHVHVAQPDQPSGVDQQGVDHESGLVQGLDADRGLEEDAEPAGVLPAVHDRAGVDEQRDQRDDEEHERPPRVAAQHDRSEVAEQVEGDEAGDREPGAGLDEVAAHGCLGVDGDRDRRQHVVEEEVRRRRQRPRPPAPAAYLSRTPAPGAARPPPLRRRGCRRRC